MDNIDEEYDRLVRYLHDSAKGAEAQTLELIRQHEAGRAPSNYRLTSELVKLNIANFKTKMTALRRPDGTVTSSRRTMEKVIHDFYSDSLVHLPPCHLPQDGCVDLSPSPFRDLTHNLVGEGTYSTRF
ncbi:unnamed protein product [Heligmosomoides polygyrus]|uniref:Protein kinase domain-containing protein n=1 Tax=Heligmosomoides polygyrus TaxID=6339 RepID=A0A183G3N9_HELPZ|nr:unnamed protein product [Heligmosomoides polygyrus]